MNEWMMEAKGHEDWITRRFHEYSVTWEALKVDVQGLTGTSRYRHLGDGQRDGWEGGKEEGEKLWRFSIAVGGRS